VKFIPSILKAAIVVGLSITLFACGSTEGEEVVIASSAPAQVQPPPPVDQAPPEEPAPAPEEPAPAPPEDPAPPPPDEPAPPPPEEPAPPPPEEPAPPPPEEPSPPPSSPEGQVLFDEDIAKDIRQSIPTDVNIPLGIQATLDVEYLGAFRALADGESTSDYAVGTLGFNPDNNSIYLAGHAHQNAIAEFGIPSELSLNESPSQVVIAEILQNYVTILNKRDEGNQTNKINGILYYNENLIVTSEIWYDGNGDNKDNLQTFSMANNLGTSPYTGMLQLEGFARAAGYMSKVPDESIELLGGDYISGWASNYSITSRYSQGPSMYVIDPQEIINATPTVTREIKSSILMSFPLSEGKSLVPDGDRYLKDISPIWGPVAQARYGFIVPGTSLFMVIGSHGGIHSGVGYKITQDGGNVCGGGCTYEASDNYNFFWLFDINDITTAENSWEVQPISYGKWSHPYDNSGGNMVKGATYDHVNKKLYISLDNAAKVGTYDRPPMILAYKVQSKN
jgi:hypothetical protein